MSMTVWKFPIILTTEQRIAMPEGAELLDVQVQQLDPNHRPQDCMFLWARVNPTRPMTTRRIWIAGTSHAAPGVISYGRAAGGTKTIGAHIATVQTGAYVWHLFDMGEPTQ